MNNLSISESFGAATIATVTAAKSNTKTQTAGTQTDTTSTTTTSASSNNNLSKLSTGAWVGILIGSIFGGLLILVIIWLAINRK